LTDAAKGQTGLSRLDAAALTAIVLVLTALFADVLFAGRAFYLRDAGRAVFPIRSVVRAIVHQGEFPFWNPYAAAGQPAAANPSYGIFYPPAWLALIGSAKTGFSLHYLFHIYLAAIGMYLLMRAGGLAPPASLFAALSLAMSGWFLSVTDLLPNFFTIAWWPLILLFARRLFRRPNRRDFAIAAILCAIQAVIGEPVALLQTWLLIAITAAMSTSSAVRSRVRLFLLLGLTAAVLASVQLVPALDLLGDSARSRGFSFELAATWSFPPARPIELLLPDVFGTMQDAGDFWWGGALYPDKGFPYILSIYSGVAVLVFAAGGLLARVRGWQLALGTLTASYLLAVGSHTPLLRLLYATRVLRVIRYPEKFVLFGLFAMVVFAAFVLDELLAATQSGGEQAPSPVAVQAPVAGDAGAPDLRTAGPRLWRFVAGTAVGAAAIAGAFAIATTSSPGALWGLRTAPLIELARQRSWIAFVMAAALVALLFMLRDRRTDPPMAMLLLLVFVFVDLGWRSWELAPRIDGSYYKPPPLAAAIAAQGDGVRLFHEAEWFRGTAIADRYLNGGTLRYWVFRNGLFPLTSAAWGIRTAIDPDFDGSGLRPTGDFVDALWRIRNSGRSDWAEVLLPMANVAWRVGYRPFDDALRAAHGRLRDISPVAIRPVETASRYYFADQLALARDKGEFIQAIVTHDVSRRVAFTAMPPFSPAPCSVLHAVETPSTAKVDVDCSGRGYLVIGITPHKYWRAAIDGVPAELHQTNLGFQGLVVDRGRHRVSMRYSNPCVIAFGMVSLLGLVSCVIAAALPRR
jgi:hypothetical protein